MSIAVDLDPIPTPFRQLAAAQAAKAAGLTESQLKSYQTGFGLFPDGFAKIDPKPLRMLMVKTGMAGGER